MILDIGGYTTLPYPVPGLFINRKRELLERWMELELFACAYRSHEGGVPAINIQVYDTSSNFIFIQFYTSAL